MADKTEAKTLLDAGAANAGVILVDDVHPLLLVPTGYAVHDCEPHLMLPTRMRGNHTFLDAESFCAYVARFKQAGPTQIYARPSPPEFRCVFNGPCPDTGPGWNDFTATYACPLSREWQVWASMDGKRQAQDAFARWIEDNAPDCADPDSATMIEVARSIEARKSVKFASDIRTSNGARELTYETTIEGSAGKGKFQIPEQFTLGLRVLEGGPGYAVTARLRYRIDEHGKLALWYDLLRPHQVLDDAVREVRAVIEAKTGLRVLWGTNG